MVFNRRGNLDQVNISESTFNEVFNFKEGLRSRAGYASTIHNLPAVCTRWVGLSHKHGTLSDRLNDVWRSPNGEIWERI